MQCSRRNESILNKGKDLSKFKHVIFLLIFSICSYAFAVDPASHPIRPTSGGSQIACPSRDFPEFIRKFSENTEVQIAFTKYSLQQQRLDVDAEPELMPVVRKLRRDQVSFPVMPNEAERKRQSLVLRIDEKIRLMSS